MKSLYLDQYDCFVRYFVRQGSSDQDPVIFIPGLITPALPLFFDMINHPLLRDTAVVLINYIGTGISDHIDDPQLFDHHPKSHAQIIKQILDQESLIVGRRFHIMGHSQGGTVGIYLAHMYQDRVLSLIISEANLFPGGGPGTRYITSFSQQEFVEREYYAMLDRWREQGRTNPKAAAMPAFQQNSHPVAIYRAAYQLVNLDADVFEILSHGLPGLPCHFVYGERNLPHSEEEAMPDTPVRSILENIGVKTHVVKNAGHMMMLDNLEGYTTIISDIVERG